MIYDANVDFFVRARKYFEHGHTRSMLLDHENARDLYKKCAKILEEEIPE